MTHHDTPNPNAAAAEAAAGSAVPAAGAARTPAPANTLKITSDKLFAGRSKYRSSTTARSTA